MIYRFLAYGFAGICMEVFWTGMGSLLNRDYCMTGRTYLWMFPIYGLAIFLEPVHNKIRNEPILVRGVVWLVLIWAIEFITGLIIKKIIGKCPWDYSYCDNSVLGLIRLDFAPAWFIVGLLFEKLHNALLILFP